MDVGGKAKSGTASLIINAQGDAFLRVFPGSEAVIKKANGDVFKLTSWQGSVPIEPTDKVSIDGSPFFRVEETRAPGMDVVIGKEKFKLKAGETLHLGRDQDQTISDKKFVNFDGNVVSREHAIIGVDELGRLYIEETARPSKNGTFVNGIRLLPGQRQYLNANDWVHLGSPIGKSSVLITLKPLDPVGTPRDSDPLKAVLFDDYKQLDLYEKTFGETIKGIDLPPPRSVRACLVVGKVGEENIRIRGDVDPTALRETIRVVPEQIETLEANESSRFEKLELTIRGKSYTYYRDKESGNRFYQLIKDGEEPRLVRDFEIFVEPPGRSNGPGTTGRDKPSGGPGTGGGDKLSGGPGTGGGGKSSGGTGTGGGDKLSGGPGTGGSDKPSGGPGTGGGDKPPGAGSSDYSSFAKELVSETGITPEVLSKISTADLKTQLRAAAMKSMGTPGTDIARLRAFVKYLDVATGEDIERLKSEMKYTAEQTVKPAAGEPPVLDPKTWGADPKLGAGAKPNSVLQPLGGPPTTFDTTPKPAGLEEKPVDKPGSDPAKAKMKAEPLKPAASHVKGKETVGRVAGFAAVVYGFYELFNEKKH